MYLISRIILSYINPSDLNHHLIFINDYIFLAVYLLNFNFLKTVLFFLTLKLHLVLHDYRILKVHVLLHHTVPGKLITLMFSYYMPTNMIDDVCVDLPVEVHYFTLIVVRKSCLPICWRILAIHRGS
jgi:hypothetical protein